MSDGESRPRRRWPYVLGILIGLLAGLGIFLSVKLRNIDDRVRDFVVEQLQQKFQSDVDLGELHVRVLPDLGVTGEELSALLHIPFRFFHLGCRQQLIDLQARLVHCAVEAESAPR